MTVTTLAKTIQDLSADEQAKLFDKLGSALEDYLLAKIDVDRLKMASKKRIPWQELQSCGQSHRK